jgi:anti-anti-sigma regulatory factor
VAIHLFNKDSGKELGEITAEQLEQLQDYLEEESEDDHDYWINGEELDFMEEEGLDAALLKLLRDACTNPEEGFEIEWKED